MSLIMLKLNAQLVKYDLLHVYCTLFTKTIPYVFSCNLCKHDLIIVVFGGQVTQK